MATAFSAQAKQYFGRDKATALAEPVVVAEYSKPSVVILAAAEYARRKALDRRGLRVDDMPDAEIEPMIAARIPPEHQYSLAEIPD